MGVFSYHFATPLYGPGSDPPLQVAFFAKLLQTKLSFSRKPHNLHELFKNGNICLHPHILVL